MDRFRIDYARRWADEKRRELAANDETVERAKAVLERARERLARSAAQKLGPLHES